MSMNHGSSMQNKLIDPVTLTFEPQNSTLLWYSKVIHYTKFEHFGIIRFWVMLQADRQTDGLENPTHADRHSQRW